MTNILFVSTYNATLNDNSQIDAATNLVATAAEKAGVDIGKLKVTKKDSPGAQYGIENYDIVVIDRKAIMADNGRNLNHIEKVIEAARTNHVPLVEIRQDGTMHYLNRADQLLSVSASAEKWQALTANIKGTDEKLAQSIAECLPQMGTGRK
jgi:hypothetical protein